MPSKQPKCASPISWVTLVEEAVPNRGEDRLAALDTPGRTLMVVADGAGGSAGGAAAAEAVRASLLACVREIPPSWSAWLKQVDLQLALDPVCGFTAAVVVEVRDDGAILGASVGDCEAWVLGAESATSLTAGQVRKPLVGSGAAEPVAFAGKLDGTLVIGSDGLWKYASHQRVRAAASLPSLRAVVEALADAARLQNGKLQDDIAILAARCK